jgi:hypothetical protein
MENRVNLYRWWKVELITDILNISFNFEWTKFFVIELITRSYRLDVSS